MIIIIVDLFLTLVSIVAPSNKTDEKNHYPIP